MIRRALALILLAAVGLTLPGCWSRIEANDLAIVSMMAIDRNEDGNLQIWLQVVVPAHAGGAAGVPGGEKGAAATFVTVTGTGKTILEASRFIQTRLSRKIFWAHARVILVGERIAKESLRPVMDFLLRQRELRLDNFILMVHGDVAEFMGVQLDLEKHPAEALREILHLRIGSVVTLGDWVRMREAAGADPFMGVARVVPPPKGAPKAQKPQLQLMGTALFHNDHLVEILDERATRGLLWMLGDIYMGVVTLELPQAPGAISLEYVASRVRRHVKIENGGVVVYFQINTEGTVSDEHANLDLGNPEIIHAIEAQMSKEVRRRIDGTLRRVRQRQVDPAGLGELVHQRYPAFWKRVVKDWRTGEYQKAKIAIQITAKVRRTGLSGAPRGIRDDELIKEVK